jgi:hypothetical protein
MEREILISDSAGQYIPLEFATHFNFESNFKNYEVVKPILEALAKSTPYDEYYWDMWMKLENEAILNLKNGSHATLHLDGDLWLIPDGYVWEEF